MTQYTEVARQGEHVPLILQQQPLWLPWQMTIGPTGRPRKVPGIPVDEPERARPWFKVADLPRTEAGGIGFLLTDTVCVGAGYLVCLDLDACRDPEHGTISDWAVTILRHFNSYTEITPTSTGLHVWLLVKNLPSKHAIRHSIVVPFAAAKNTKGKRAQLEVFGLGPARYVTVSGRRLHELDDKIAIVDDLDWLIEEFDLSREHELAEVKEYKPQADDFARIRWGLLDAGLLDEPDTLDNYESWLRVGMALAQFGDAGLELWDEWSARSADSYEDGCCHSRFGGFDGSVNPSTIFWMFDAATGKGWRGRFKRAHAAGVFGTVQGTSQVKARTSGLSPDDILDQWKEEGPIVHVSTGIPKLDEMTGGGFTIPCRVYFNGAPDAGKTAFALQLADHYMAEHGMCVGMFAVDEEPGDLLQRFVQRRGWMRKQCEARDQLDEMRDQLRELPVRFFDPEHTIESAAAALSEYADGEPALLVIDSLQTVRSETEDEGSMYRAVSARVAAIRRVSDRYRLQVIVTSEMSRAAYRDPDNRIDDMASGKESGAIEYSARVMLALRAVAGESGLLELRVVKNKLGPRTRDDEGGIFLQMDRERQTLTQDAEFVPPTSGKAGSAERQVAGAVEAVEWLGANSGRPAGELRAHLNKWFAARDGKSMGGDLWTLTKAELGSGLIVTQVGREHRLSLDRSQIPEHLQQPNDGSELLE